MAIFGLAAGYLLILNLCAYGAFYIDKKLAQSGERRISESSLLTLALFGGSAGAIIAQHQFRHKTKKQPFKSQLYVIAILHIFIVCAGLLPDIRAKFIAI